MNITYTLHHKCNEHRQRGSSMLELPAMLIIVFVVLALPLMSLISVGLRATFFYSAVRIAAHEAACANSGTSAIGTASSLLALEQKSWSGVIIPQSKIKADLLATSISAPYKTTRLSMPVAKSYVFDTSNNLYRVEVSAVGQISPLINIGHTIAVQIPGLNCPAIFTVFNSEYCEHPTQMNQ